MESRLGLVVGGIALGSCLASNPDWGDETGQQPTSSGSTTATTSTSTGPSSATTASTTNDPSTTAPSISSPGETDSTTALGTSTGLGDQYAATVISDGPVGYWRLGDAVTPVAVDENTMNDGTYLANVMLGQPSLTVGDDSSVAFPGDGSSFVRVGDVFGFGGQTPFSVEVWVQHDIQNAGCIIGKSFYTGSEYQGWFVASHNDRIRFDRLPGSLANADLPPLGVPYHLVATYDGVTSRVYFDGELIGSRVNEIAMAEHEGDLTIGDCNNWGNFAGLIDEVAIYDYALTPMQIATHTAGGHGQ